MYVNNHALLLLSFICTAHYGWSINTPLLSIVCHCKQSFMFHHPFALHTMGGLLLSFFPLSAIVNNHVLYIFHHPFALLLLWVVNATTPLISIVCHCKQHALLFPSFICTAHYIWSTHFSFCTFLVQSCAVHSYQYYCSIVVSLLFFTFVVGF